MSGSSLRVAREHPPHDLVVDLLRRLGEPDHVVHVARPLGRAHAHHVRLRALVPAAAALARELLAHLVPDVLGVDDARRRGRRRPLRSCSNARDVVAPDVAHRRDAGEPHREVEVGAEVADHLAHAVLAAGGEPPHVRAAEPDRRGAERERAEDVGARADPAVER